MSDPMAQIDAPAFTEGEAAEKALEELDPSLAGEEVDIACRAEGCGGRRAIMRRAPHGLVYYVCTTCRKTRTVNTGSHVDL